ncbi:hypothetical protein DCAR_0727566 [Daucus carota subsp. sativus]|uniref:Uncharacterized protein n=1 Tax=Daucus carota subsp. sativus TaxID=79200 RepID=A0AAF0XJH6_DAUCS|nr:hypothetical protein DCAR_0727566 [Daucus carota subsp. sativus]
MHSNLKTTLHIFVLCMLSEMSSSLTIILI